jgi:hypothetical protein
VLVPVYAGVVLLAAVACFLGQVMLSHRARRDDDKRD